MNNLPLKVSVIVPSYNMAEFLPDTLESILKQDYQPLEIIVVDDGSTDNTASVIEPYIDKVRYVYQTNGGEASARNTGIKASTGEALMFVDADDLLPEGAISTLANKLAQLNQDYCLVHGEMEKFDNVTGGSLGFTCFKDISQNRRKIFTEMSNLILASLVRREALDAIGMFPEEVKWSAITEVVMKLAKVGKLASISDIVYQYRIRPNSMSKQFSYERAVILEEQSRRRLKSLLRGESWTTKVEAWSVHYLRAGINFRKYKPNKTRIFFVLSILIYPFNLIPLKLLKASFSNKLN